MQMSWLASSRAGLFFSVAFATNPSAVENLNTGKTAIAFVGRSRAGIKIKVQAEV